MKKRKPTESPWIRMRVDPKFKAEIKAAAKESQLRTLTAYMMVATKEKMERDAFLESSRKR